MLRGSVRERIWRSALFAPVVATVISLLLPSGAAGIPAGGTRVLARRLSPDLTFGISTSGLANQYDHDIATVLALGWAIGTVWFLVGIALSQIRISRLDRRPVTNADTLGLLEEAVRSQRWTRSVRLSESRELSSPAALSSREICLPRDGFHELPISQRAALLAHEVAHLVRRDPLWVRALSLMAAITFFQPLVRLAMRRLREEAELLSDARAAAATGAPFALADALIALAAGYRERALTHSAASPSAFGLARRVSCLVDPPVASGFAGRLRSGALQAGATCLIVMSAALPASTHHWVAHSGPGMTEPFEVELTSHMQVRLRLDQDEFVVDASGVQLDHATGSVLGILPGGWIRVERTTDAAEDQWLADASAYTPTPDWAKQALKSIAAGPVPVAEPDRQHNYRDRP
jgi:beta-lactamase regulating signal transducer with metallopeptidase domain